MITDSQQINKLSPHNFSLCVITEKHQLMIYFYYCTELIIWGIVIKIFIKIMSKLQKLLIYLILTIFNVLNPTT